MAGINSEVKDYEAMIQQLGSFIESMNLAAESLTAGAQAAANALGDEDATIIGTANKVQESVKKYTEAAGTAASIKAALEKQLEHLRKIVEEAQRDD